MIVDTTQTKIVKRGIPQEEVNKVIFDLEECFPNCGSESAKLVLRSIDMIKGLRKEWEDSIEFYNFRPCVNCGHRHCDNY